MDDITVCDCIQCS